MRNKVRASVTGERGFRPVPVLMESVASSGKVSIIGYFIPVSNIGTFTSSSTDIYA